jgi:non-ribosomal peptide synthetase component E (peptide arylation enzyme)
MTLTTSALPPVDSPAFESIRSDPRPCARRARAPGLLEERGGQTLALSYGELDQRMDQVAAALQRWCAARAGDRGLRHG